MTCAECAEAAPALAEAGNGLVVPLYFPRQIVQAADLTLDRTSRDAELARMRRLLHGWGVVMGLVPRTEADTLTVSAGYGVTPTGQEVLLTDKASFEGIAAAVLSCCGGPGDGCNSLEPRDDRAAPSDPVVAWLIARPTRHDAEPRPSIPHGCEHPANALHPSRSCAGVRLELLCELPATHVSADPLPDDLAGIVCGPQATDTTAVMLTMPELPGPEASFVVLGQLMVTDGVASYLPQDRRTLLPLQTLQAWVALRTCPKPYYVNRRGQRGQGEHEVHAIGCPTPAAERNRLELGSFYTGGEAMAAARRHFDNVDGCANCMPAFHTR